MEEEKLSDILHSIKTEEFSVSSFLATLFRLLKFGKGKYMIQALLQAEANYNTPSSSSSAPEPQQIAHLLVNSAGNCDFYDSKKQTVLHYASDYGWLEIVQTLLKKGADPNVKDVEHTTPLMFATRSVQKDVVDLLIESGADIMCRKIDNRTLLHAASTAGWLEFAQFLLNKGANVNATTNRGFTPLHLAARSSHKDVVALLMDSGADTACCTLAGYSPLHFGAQSGCLEIVQCIVEKADHLNDKRFNCLLFRCVSPLFLACICKNVEVIEYLMKIMNKKNGCDDTPLNFIIGNCPNFKLAGILIEKGGYLNFIDYYRALRNPSLKEGILQNVQVSTQALINKFNNKDLPDFYKLHMSVRKLPPIKSLMIKCPEIIKGIEEIVRSEIETKGHCNLMKPKGIVLSMMAVKSCLDYYDSLRNKSQLKRLATGDSHDQSQSLAKMQCLD